MSSDPPLESSGTPTPPPTAAPMPALADPHLALIRESMAGNHKITLILVVAVLFGQTVTAILSGAGLAAELGVFKVYSTDDKRNATAVERGERAELDDLADDLAPTD